MDQKTKTTIYDANAYLCAKLLSLIDNGTIKTLDDMVKKLEKINKLNVELYNLNKKGRTMAQTITIEFYDDWAGEARSYEVKPDGRIMRPVGCDACNDMPEQGHFACCTTPKALRGYEKRYTNGRWYCFV